MLHYWLIYFRNAFKPAKQSKRMQDDFDDFDFSAQDYSEDDFFTEYIDRRKMKKVFIAS